jgi:hypothetical protein
MIECPVWTAKKVNSQAQREGMSKVSKSDGQMETESHICRERRPARGREESILGSEVEEPK